MAGSSLFWTDERRNSKTVCFRCLVLSGLLILHNKNVLYSFLGELN